MQTEVVKYFQWTPLKYFLGGCLIGTRSNSNVSVEKHCNENIITEIENKTDHFDLKPSNTPTKIYNRIHFGFELYFMKMKKNLTGNRVANQVLPGSKVALGEKIKQQTEATCVHRMTQTEYKISASD